MAIIQSSDRVSRPFLVVTNRSRPKLFDRDKNANPITNLLDTHFLQNDLIAFNEIVPIHVVDYITV